MQLSQMRGETVRRRGFRDITQCLGDRSLFFGYPHQAHETDAEDERCGQNQLSTLKWRSLKRGPRFLQTRVGAATGLVVVREASRMRVVRRARYVGETPNLAQRVCKQRRARDR